MTRTMAGACVMLVLAAGLGCDRLGGGKPDAPDAAAATVAPTTAPSASSTATASSTAKKATGPHAAGAQPGKCHRGMCNLGREYCCETAGGDEHQCASRASAAKMPYCYPDDQEWLITMECNQFTGCGGEKKCCKRNVAGHAGMTQDICADSCEIAEVCGQGGACKSGQTCKADESERSGGICVGPATAKKPATTTIGMDMATMSCPAGYTMKDKGTCMKICANDGACGSAEKCSEAGGLKVCQ